MPLVKQNKRGFMSYILFSLFREDDEEEEEEKGTLSNFLKSKKQKTWHGKSSSFFSERSFEQVKSVENIFQ